MTAKKRMLEIVRQSIKDGHERKKARIARQPRADVVFRTPVAQLKKATGDTGDYTTEALNAWTTKEYLDYFLACLRMERPSFRPGGAAKKYLAQMRRFLDVISTQNAAPRSICLVLSSLAVAAPALQLKWKMKIPFGPWVLSMMTDQVLEEFAHLIYTSDSPQYLLNENTDVQELPIAKTTTGWLLTLASGQVLQILDSETDRILNPKLRRRLGLSKPRPADDDLPILT